MDACKPEIEYPCAWNYRIIGAVEEQIRAAVSAVVGEREYGLVHSNASATGKYVSLRLTLVVRDEEHRLGIGQALLRNDAVRYVL